MKISVMFSEEPVYFLGDALAVIPMALLFHKAFFKKKMFHSLRNYFEGDIKRSAS